MDQCYADGGINPSAIPGANLDPDAVVQAASDLRTGGGSVRDEGAATVAEWRKIGPSYEAPEASTLLTVMDPVETTARDFGDAVERVADALDTYAETTRAIKAALDSVRTDAYAFRRKIGGDPEWQYDQGLVDENTALVRRVNTQQTALWEAERTCANAIRALYCAAPWVVDDGSGSPMAYGAAEIPTDTEMPWGGEVSRKDHCPKSAAVGVKRFVWDGFVVDGLGGTLQGLGMLVGIDGMEWSWETMRTSWVGMGSLIGYADGEWSWGNAGEAWKGLGKGLIAYDTWSEDPARAAGGVGFNLLTIVVPAGAAVSGVKGAATAAGTSGRVANAFAKGAKVADMVDPVALGINGARAALPKLGDMATGLRLSVGGMIDEIRTPEIARPSLEVPSTDLGVPSTRVIDGVDTPPVRNPDTLPDDLGVGGRPDSVNVEVPVRERELVTVGDGPGAPQGPEAPQAPGGLGQGADDLVGSPRGPETTTPQQTTPTGGGGTEVPGGRGDGTSGPGDAGGGPGRPAGEGPAAGGGVIDDAVRGDAHGPSETAPDEVGSAEGPAEPARPDGDPVGDRDTPPRDPGTDGPPPRQYGLENGVEHSTRHAPEQIDVSTTAEHKIDAKLADTALFERHGLEPWTRDDLVRVVLTPVDDLSAAQKIVLREIADALPAPSKGDVVQKVLPHDVVREMLDPATANSAKSRILSGSITRVEDTAMLDTVLKLQDGLRLDYDDVTFLPHDESVFVVRGELEADVADVSRFSEMGGTGMTDGWHDPYTGNGFLKSDGLIPEYRIDQPYTHAHGSELWEVLPGGNQRLAAVFNLDSGWIRVA